MIYIASDHAGLEYKKTIIKFLSEKGLEIKDCGASEYNKYDDYPDFISQAAQAVSLDSENSKGIIIGGSGQAEAMLSNKYKNVRCALFYATAVPLSAVDITGQQSKDQFEIVKLSRSHNNANILSLSARFLTETDITKAVEVWLETPFEGGRHQRRIEKISIIEKENFK